MKKRVVHQDYVHHLQVEAIEVVGQWHVFNAADLPEYWPTYLTRLAINITEVQLQHLRDNIVEAPIFPRDIPEDPVPEPAAVPEEIVVQPEGDTTLN